MENIFETRLLTQEDFLQLDLNEFKDIHKMYIKIRNIQQSIKNQKKNPIKGKEGIDFTTCPVCGYKVKGALKVHVNHWHPLFDWENFRVQNPNYVVYCEKTKKKTAMIGDKNWMTTDRGRKWASDRMKGSKNINHKSNTTALKRKQISPKSIEFYKKKYPDLSLEEQKKLLQKHYKKTKENTPPESRQQRVEYWISRGYSLKEAQENVKERQAVGRLDKFIERYGEKEGTERWTKRQEKWRKTIKDKYIAIGGAVSSVSLDLFEYLDNYFEYKEFQYGIMNEKYISNKEKEKTFGYDFTDNVNNKIIEFNGDYWHMNPKIYKASDFNKNKKMTAKEIWEYDKNKINLAKKYGYDVLVVWEKDYRNNQEKIIKQCINFLND